LLAPLRKRLPCLDRILRSVETYTSLFEQWGWLSYVKAASTAFAGAAVVIWTYFTESWLPLALVAGLGTIIALAFLPAALNQFQTKEQGNKGADLAEVGRGYEISRLREMEHDVQLALSHLVDLTSMWVLRVAYNKAPTLDPQPPHVTKEWCAQQQELAQSYINQVRSILTNTGWAQEIPWRLSAGQSEAEQKVRELLPPNIDPFDYRAYLIVRTQCEHVAAFLHNTLDANEGGFQNTLGALQFRIQRYKQH
jgi:hypothetical protein